MSPERAFRRLCPMSEGNHAIDVQRHHVRACSCSSKRRRNALVLEIASPSLSIAFLVLLLLCFGTLRSAALCRFSEEEGRARQTC